MAIVKYEGKFGKFEYDDTIWSTGIDEEGEEFFHYEGKETNGSRIKVPDGMTNVTGLFMNTEIESQPLLPGSVKVADYCFAGCKNLKTINDLPSGLKSGDSMYTYCVAIRKPPVLPDGLKSANYMFDGCLVLEEMANFPSALRHAEYMYANCPNLKNRKPVPDSVLNKDNILFNSEDEERSDKQDLGLDNEYDDYSDLGDVWLEQSKLDEFTEQHQQAYDAIGNEIEHNDDKSIDLSDIKDDKSVALFDEPDIKEEKNDESPDFRI